MKSQVKTLLRLVEKVLLDLSHQCGVRELTDRDVITLRARVEHEGLSFLTIALPEFCSDFEKSLEHGSVDTLYFRNFKKYKRIPAFLRGIVRQVFDVNTGNLLEKPSIPCIKAVRQICLVMKKVRIPCSEEREMRAIQGYIKIEEDLAQPRAQFDDDFVAEVSSVLWGEFFRRNEFRLDKILPKHGPGATADRIRGNSKYKFKHWHERLEPFFPLVESCFVSYEAISSSEFKGIRVLSEGEEPPVKVIFVPKTLKSPRVIAMEPVCMQYCQQAISSWLMSCLQSDPLTAGQINFSDQKVNQKLAIASSLDRFYSTIDLSEASDRVSNDLVMLMFSPYHDFHDAVQACRSKKAVLPNGDVLTLRKFASMGSALCFPIESMVFYTLCVAARLHSRGLPVTLRNVRLACRRVFIYGDDIVVPVSDTPVTVEYLQQFHCKVNPRKCFSKGNFRESCGCDAYLGVTVNPVYVREVSPNSKHDVSEIISWVATARLFEKQEMTETALMMFKHVISLIGKLPINSDMSPGLGVPDYGSCRYLLSLSTKKKFCRRTQRLLTLSYVPSVLFQKDPLNGYPALLKCLLKLERSVTPISDMRHLSLTARRGCVALKRRWVPVI